MKIRDLFSFQPQTFSFEFFPPKTPQDVDDLLVRARELKALGPSFISVTYGAGGSTRRSTIDLVCRLQAELDMVAMAHVTCVGHSQAELREVLEELRDRGVQKFFVDSTGASTNPDRSFALSTDVQYDLWKNVISRLELRWDHSLSGEKTWGGTSSADDSRLNEWMLAANVIYKF